jgi:TonB family protein
VLLSGENAGYAGTEDIPVSNAKSIGFEVLAGIPDKGRYTASRPGGLRVYMPTDIGSYGGARACGYLVCPIENLDVLPRLRHGAKPRYPRKLLDSRIAGKVVLLVLLDTHGHVTVLNVLQSDNEEFKQSAVDAVETYVYDPPTLKGRPVNTEFTLPIRFSVD